MFSKKFLGLCFSSFLAFSILPSATQAAENLEEDIKVDSLGYEYTTKAAHEINYDDGDFYTVLLQGDADSEDAIYAVYDTSEVEKYESEKLPSKGLPTTFAIAAASSSIPTTFSGYYSSSGWITRTEGISLSLYPKAPAYQKSSNPIAQAQLEKYRWEVVYNKYKNDKRWKNTNSMKGQLRCHAEVAKGVKTPWNIEPYRTTTNYAKILAKGCNPPVGY
ncbi:DUF2599 domain-containing protein [Priestia megaterium]|nr:DUF2599 domain-containing protein [Priestia megaterium]